MSCTTTANTVVHGHDSYEITNIHVIDVVAGQIDYKNRLCIVDGVIADESGKPCKHNIRNNRTIDGQGGYLTPGLIDLHVHMFEKQGLVFALSHGVTHVRIMNGVSHQLQWRDDVNAGKYLASTATVSSPIISGYENAIVHHGLTTSEEARAAVKKYHEQGYDLIKAYGNLSESAFSALMDESRKLSIPVAKHGPNVPEPLHIRDYADMQSYEHVEDIFYVALDRENNIEKLKPFIDTFKRINVPIAPTLNIYAQLTRLSDEKESYLNQLPHYYISNIFALEDKGNQVKRWLKAPKEKAEQNQQTLKFLLRMTKALHDAGIPLVVGSDSGNLLSPHGIATHNEMRLFAEAGIDSFSILQSATSIAAKTLGLGDEIGQIKQGFNADFIYTINNPIKNLNTLKTPDAVVKRGIWLDRAALQELRAKAKKSKRLWPELKVYSEMITR